MDGILLVNKPKGMTSHDVIYVLRKALNTKKLGHTGTLDPDATGVLVVGVNKGTKIMKYLNSDQKKYQATIKIGESTDTLDDQGTVIDSMKVTKIDNIDDIIASFKGIYRQTPPMYSAIKYKGKRLYEYARKGITIDDIPSRDINVIDIKRTSDIIYKDGVAYVDYIVHASKGLYVRTLSYDIGKKLGYPAYNYALKRISAGQFQLDDCYTIEDIQSGNYSLISLTNALDFMEKITIDDEITKHVENGMAISLRKFSKPKLTRIVDKDDNLLAIYDKHPTESKMKAINIFK